MSRRYWLPIIAIVGLILSAQQNAEAQGDQRRAAQSQAAPKPLPQPSIPPALQNSLDRIGTALETANRRNESGEEVQRADDNLLAQREMVRWAKWMFRVGVAEAIITFAGVMLVLATLLYSKRAVEAARDAVTEAQKATVTAREIGEAQVRAYLSCEDCTCKVEEGTFIFWPVFKNTGQSPATKIRVEVDDILRDSWLNMTKYEVRDLRGHGGPIAAGDTGHAAVRVTADEITAPLFLFEAPEFHASVDGGVFWTDVFGKEHIMAFTYTLAEIGAVKRSGPESPEFRRDGALQARNRSPITAAERAEFEAEMAAAFEDEEAEGPKGESNRDGQV